VFEKKILNETKNHNPPPASEMVGPSYACFVNFKRAFDNVWHQGLLYKLKAERNKKP